jgi:hypothetical protein
MVVIFLLRRIYKKMENYFREDLVKDYVRTVEIFVLANPFLWFKK